MNEREQRDDVLSDVVALFVKPRDRRRARAKPNRCIDCGRVTRHVRCHDCSGATACAVCRWVRP